MNIQHEVNGHQGNFFIEENGEKVAMIVYTMSRENTLIIEHTEVDKALQGKNIGFDLVERVVEYAREKGFKILPQCSFARAIFKRQPAFSDVLISANQVC